MEAHRTGTNATRYINELAVYFADVLPIVAAVKAGVMNKYMEEMHDRESAGDSVRLASGTKAKLENLVAMFDEVHAYLNNAIGEEHQAKLTEILHQYRAIALSEVTAEKAPRWK